MRYKGRKWNNILILSVIVFIGVLNLPTLIKTYLIPLEQKQEATSQVLLHPHFTIASIYSSEWALEKKKGQWVLSPPLSLSGHQLLNHWQNIVGTVIDSETYLRLSRHLPVPQTVEVWYREQEEPQRITFYQMPSFWLFKNWQGQWIAVTVETNYLFPQQSSLYNK